MNKLHQMSFFTTNGEEKTLWLKRLSMLEEGAVARLRRTLLANREADDEKQGTEDYEISKKEAYVYTAAVKEDGTTPFFSSVEDFQKDMSGPALEMLYSSYRIHSHLNSGILNSFNEDTFAEITTDIANPGDENTVSPFYSRLDAGARYNYTRILASRYLNLLEEKYSGGGQPSDGDSSIIQAG